MEGTMKSKKLAALGLTALMGVSALTGCAGGKTSDKNTKTESKEATLTVWSPSEDQSEEQGNWLKKELDAFQQAHPEWKLTFNTGVCPEGDAKNLVASDPGAAADVFMYANDQIPDLLKANALAELGGSTVEAIKKNNDATTVSTVTYNNSIYGVPFTGNTWFLYYDKRVFSADDAKSLDTMLKKGKVGFPLSNSWYFASTYVANGCTLFGKDGTDGKAGIDFGGDKATAVTNYLIDLAKNPNFKDANGLSASTLGDGTINALFSGSWDYKSVVDALGQENVGIAVPPKFNLNGKEVQMKAFAGSKAIGVNPNSKNSEIAVALAAFLGSSKAQQDHYDLRKVIPSDTTLKVSDDLSKVQMSTIENCAIVQPLQSGMGQYWTPAESMGKEIIAGTVTHDNAAEKTESMNKAMNTAAVQ